MNIKYQYLRSLFVTVAGAAVAAAAAPPIPTFNWTTVINNNDLMPGAPNEQHFNSYNQPSVNLNGLVVIRARSKGGDENVQTDGHGPTHGIYSRDMTVYESPIISILDRNMRVPLPNNLNTTFVETPSFPRIDMESDTIATRGNHQPVWIYTPDDGDQTRAGTTGIYSNPFGELITGAAKLGNVADLFFFEVPEFPDVAFEVFPGAPSVTQGDTIVFKGNYTDPDGNAGTGVYYRELVDEAAGGISPVVLIANSTDTHIPGTDTIFGSTAPPSAAGQSLVFAGFDNEDTPTMGGIYLAALEPQPFLDTLVSIGQRVPGESRSDTFNNLGEGGAFDGRFVGFWGAWGEDTKTVRLYCQTEGNKDRIDYCNQALVCEGAIEPIGDSLSKCDESGCYQDKQVPVNQGFFVHDSKTRRTWLVARTGEQFDELLFWNYSGKTPCTGGGHSDEGAEDDGEPARWRSSAFIAVSGRSATYQAAFKARTGELVDKIYVDPVDGIYLGRRPTKGQPAIVTVLDTAMDGRTLDPEAPVDSTITELGIEREGLRGDWLAISAKMETAIADGAEKEADTEEDDMAGVYLTCVSGNPLC